MTDLLQCVCTWAAHIAMCTSTCTHTCSHPHSHTVPTSYQLPMFNLDLKMPNSRNAQILGVERLSPRPLLLVAYFPVTHCRWPLTVLVWKPDFIQVWMWRKRLALARQGGLGRCPCRHEAALHRPAQPTQVWLSPWKPKAE